MPPYLNFYHVFLYSIQFNTSCSVIHSFFPPFIKNAFYSPSWTHLYYTMAPYWFLVFYQYSNLNTYIDIDFKGICVWERTWSVPFFFLSWSQLIYSGWLFLDSSIDLFFSQFINILNMRFHDHLWFLCTFLSSY